MNRIALYLGIASGLVASCSTQELDFQTPAQKDVVFYASFEQPEEEGTRVFANNDLLLRWDSDDRVSIFDKWTSNSEYRFTGKAGADSGTFEIVKGGSFWPGSAIPHVVSVFPYQETTAISENEKISYTFPAEQQFAFGRFSRSTNTMVAVSEDNVFQYKNVGGYLLIKLYGEGVSVSSIALKGNNGEKLAGRATLSMPLGGVPAVEMENDATEVITLTFYSPFKLGATADEAIPFWFVLPPVSFSKGLSITVTTSIGYSFKKTTTKSIAIERSKLSKMSPLMVEENYPIPEAIDLGLPSGLKWASCNLGALIPEAYGDYYAWGEVDPHYEPGYAQSNPTVWKEVGYTWETYKWCNGSEDTMTKYCTIPSFGYNGFVDGKTVLDPVNDAAHVKLGGDWRMPTNAEWTELRENCTWTLTVQNRVAGYLVTASNGNSIFLPFAGYRYNTNLYNVGSKGEAYYWSSSLHTDASYAAWCWTSYPNHNIRNTGHERSNGYSIRPVCDGHN